jgi:hypothetical protein
LLRSGAFLLALPLLAAPEFYQFSVDQDRVSGAPDFSHLNEPITARDRIFVRDGHFYRVGPDLTPNTGDDTRVNFWGVNLAFSANFPDTQDAARIAKRLRRLGVNIVRLHHMDSSPDRVASSATSLLTQDPYPTLNPYSVERLRVFIDALKAEGIYVNLNLHVGYTFRPAVDGSRRSRTFRLRASPSISFTPASSSSRPNTRARRSPRSASAMIPRWPWSRSITRARWPTAASADRCRST